MTDADLDLVATRLAGDQGSSAVLLVGPSLGTSVTALWDQCAALLGDRFEVVGWDLPGHGRSPAATGPFSVANLAASVTRLAERLRAHRPVAYAGVSLAGAVGFQLAVDGGPWDVVVTLASAPRIGEPNAWHERADLVRRAGTAVMVDGSSRRWFAPGFTDRAPETTSRLLSSLVEADAASYSWACEALAGFDLRAQMVGAVTPVVAVTGEHDSVVPPEALHSGFAGDVRVLPGVAHLPPAEDPAATAALLSTVLSGASA
jgi:pimeloyl-ACP methyl ester carboxylesterase